MESSWDYLEVFEAPEQERLVGRHYCFSRPERLLFRTCDHSTRGVIGIENNAKLPIENRRLIKVDIDNGPIYRYDRNEKQWVEDRYMLKIFTGDI